MRGAWAIYGQASGNVFQKLGSQLYHTAEELRSVHIPTVYCIFIKTGCIPHEMKNNSVEVYITLRQIMS